MCVVEFLELLESLVSVRGGIPGMSRKPSMCDGIPVVSGNPSVHGGIS